MLRLMACNLHLCNATWPLCFPVEAGKDRTRLPVASQRIFFNFQNQTSCGFLERIWQPKTLASSLILKLVARVQVGALPFAFWVLERPAMLSCSAPDSCFPVLLPMPSRQS